MKNSSQKREQNEKKKEALNEYMEALKVVDYWTGKVRELNGAFIYRSPSSNTELPTKAIGNRVSFHGDGDRGGKRTGSQTERQRSKEAGSVPYPNGKNSRPKGAADAPVH